MAKKDKKEKKQKKLKPGKQRKEKQQEGPNVPYPGADSTKTFFAKVLIVLCLICVGLMIYTIHYMKFINAKNERETIAAAMENAAAPPTGPIWFLRPDGTYVGANGLPIGAESTDEQESGEQAPGQESDDQKPAGQESGAEGEQENT